MGDLGVDTTLTGGDGRYTAVLSQDWEIWGPCGGYIAAVLMRAAGAHTRFERPASFIAHFLGSARFDEVQLDTSTVRAGGRSESVRVSMSQDGKAIAEAMVWCVPTELDGFEVDWTEHPGIPGPDACPTIQDLTGGEEGSWFKFWDNFEYRPLDWLPREEWDANRPHEPTYRAWFQTIPTAVFDDPWLEAGRVMMPLDIAGWPAVGRAMSPDDDGKWIAPNLDLSVAFHQPTNGSTHLLLDAEARIATGGLVGSESKVWSTDGRLLATAIETMLCRRLPG